MLLGITLAFALALLLVGIVEHRRHLRRLRTIPVRVNVNGSRGKSTVTRLVAGVIASQGLRTVAKTTGTTARLIYSFREEERPLRRRLEGPNIREQLGMVREAARNDARAVVAECMAVKPDYQAAVARIMDANIGIVTNVLADHLDEMGPTLDDVADAYATTVPAGGDLVITDDGFVEHFRRVAAERGARVTVADAAAVPADHLRRFDYMVFPEHVAIGWAVADILGIDRDDALEGMLAARPDPYTTRILEVGPSAEPAYFVNAFAANDPESTLAIWRNVQRAGYPTDGLVVVMNCRSDRVERTKLFAQEVLPRLPAACVVAVGEITRPVTAAYETGALPTQELLDLQGADSDRIIEELVPYLSDRVVLGIGNIAGPGMALVERFEDLADRRADDPDDTGRQLRPAGKGG